MNGPLSHFSAKELQGAAHIVAVSGGVDSMVLCHLLVQHQISFHLAHVNFGLRGAESDGDEALVRNFALQNNIEISVLKPNLEHERSAAGQGIQESAREVRYKWFNQLHAQLNAKYILTAHNQNDQVETILHKYIRGGGLAALRGMKVMHGHVYRPLLQISKTEILAYANENKVAWREDSSNAKLHYTRNRMRHEVIPMLKTINSNLEETIAERAEIFGEAETYIQQQLQREIDTHCEQNNDTISISTHFIEQHIAPKTLVWQLLQPYGFLATQTNEAIKLLQSESGKSITSSTHRLLRDRDNLLLHPLEIALALKPITIAAAPFKVTEPHLLKGEVIPIPDSIEANKTIAYLAAEKITWPITLRPWNAGDKFIPLGMKGHQKLSDFFVSQKLSMIDKEKIMVLESGGKIAWVVGYRISEEFKLSATSIQTLRVTIDQP
jgi:tRNA(Ile)-lysidine synthase